MKGQSVRLLSRWVRWSLVLSVVIIATLAASLCAVTPAPARTLHAQQVLLNMAAQQPEATVSVIVQKWSRDKSIESLVARLGGVVTKDLRIINAFAADMPGSAVPQLAAGAGVRWVSVDAPVVKACTPCTSCIDTSRLVTAYVNAIGADRVWNAAPYVQGQNVTVAVVDSGISHHDDLRLTTQTTSALRVVASANVTNQGGDVYGHGTHVAGIIGGNGARSGGAVIGVAPKVNLVDIKVTNNQAGGMTSDVVAGLQWVYDNRDRYGIRVLNLSLNSSVAESYHTSPLDAALEILWFNRIVVVVSAGNNRGDGVLYPPANDPFVITVGATDDRGTPETGDDVMAPYSAYGSTESGSAKPDLVAPGTNIISLLAGSGASLVRAHSDHLVSGFEGAQYYFRMSGTSMASAVTAGAVALLLQDEPGLTPDQVKYRLKTTTRRLRGAGTGAGYLDIYAAVRGRSKHSANTGLIASRLLWTGSNPVNWDSVNWDSVNWDSVNWDSVNWDSDYWGN